MAAKEILGVEAGGFAMLVASVAVLALSVPIAARLGRQSEAVFRRSSFFWGATMLVVLFGTVLIIGLAES